VTWGAGGDPADSRARGEPKSLNRICECVVAAFDGN
jgi:hypothetical protein